MNSEAALYSDFSTIRYAQCWEDADILLEGLDVQPGDVCVSISSAGDNALAMLSRGPARVIALDLSPAQLACLELRVAAFRELDHRGLLELIGSVPSNRRIDLYLQCRRLLSRVAYSFWDAHQDKVREGIGGAGKFEHYFSIFRNSILPLVHSKEKISRLLEGGPPESRERFYTQEWDSFRWRLLFNIFFSRPVMGRLGRDPAFFRHVQGSVAARILRRTRQALVTLDPSENPYLQWILTGRHLTALPFSLRPENFEAIRDNLDRLEWHCLSIEDFLERSPGEEIDCFNLSDIFEYISYKSYVSLLGKLVESGRRGSRLAYWNMLAERKRPDTMADRLKSLDELSGRLFLKDKAFFYSAFIVEEMV